MKLPQHVILQPVDRHNWRTCLQLSLTPEQRAFVAPNGYSLAQAYVFPELTPRAVQAGDRIVGFVLYGVDPGDQRVWLLRLMIDQAHQRRGYGRAALLAVIEAVKGELNARELKLSVSRDNPAAATLYRNAGFLPTGRLVDGQVEMLLRL